MSDLAKRWQVIITRQAERRMKRLPKPLIKRLQLAIKSLAEDARPSGYKKMIEHDDLYRIRVGDWRIIYAIEDDRLLVLIVTVGPRGSVYRDL
ncbi:MAG: type II toxin-antitoxin system RelE/ParE family toxin [Chloroflexota bacterium]|jgi:mRNA interferase RelE/StbE